MDGTLLAWFGSLDGVDRAAVLEDILNAVERMDPGFAVSRATWRQGKTVKFSACLPLPSGPVEADVHVMVDPDDPMLMPNLRRRAARRDLAFEPGCTESGDVGRELSWVASLGMGSLSVLERQGSLMVVAKIGQVLAMPLGLEPGGRLPFAAPPGIVAKLFSGQMFAIFGFSDPRPDEIGAFSAAPIRLGLVEASSGLMLICMSVPGVVSGWADLPYSVAIEPGDNRHITQPAADGTMAIVMALVDSGSSRVAGVRTIRAPAPWTRKFNDLVEKQAGLASYGRADYDRDVTAAYARWPSPALLAPAISHVADAVAVP